MLFVQLEKLRPKRLARLFLKAYYAENPRLLSGTDALDKRAADNAIISLLSPEADGTELAKITEEQAEWFREAVNAMSGTSDCWVDDPPAPAALCDVDAAVPPINFAAPTTTYRAGALHRMYRILCSFDPDLGSGSGPGSSAKHTQTQGHWHRPQGGW